MDNKISFIAGWALTTVTTITLVGVFRAAIIGLVGGFFGLLGKEIYFLAKAQMKEIKPSAKVWIGSKVKWLKGVIKK